MSPSMVFPPTSLLVVVRCSAPAADAFSLI
jgi:hypothetical protein